VLRTLTAVPEETVKTSLQPWQLLLPVLAGWVNRRQQDAIAYLQAENRILREKFGEKRILLNDDQRRQLAVKGRILGRKMLDELAGIVTPETNLRWRRELVAGHWDYSDRRRAAGHLASPAAQTTAPLLRNRQRRYDPPNSINQQDARLPDVEVTSPYAVTLK
jgi:hypothetical protein